MIALRVAGFYTCYLLLLVVWTITGTEAVSEVVAGTFVPLYSAVAVGLVLVLIVGTPLYITFSVKQLQTSG